MHLYDALVHSREELEAALATDGVLFALDLRKVSVVLTEAGVVLQHAASPGLPLTLPYDAVRVMLPHRESFPAPPQAAVRFAVGSNIHVGGTSR